MHQIFHGEDVEVMFPVHTATFCSCSALLCGKLLILTFFFALMLRKVVSENPGATFCSVQCSSP